MERRGAVVSPRRGRFPLTVLVAGVLAGGILASSVAASAAPSAVRAGASGTLAAAVSSGRGLPAAATKKSPPRAFFGLGPASATKVDGRPYFTWGATPGGRLNDHVAIVNLGTSPVTVAVFVTNAVNVAHGGTGFLPRGQARGGPASWITLHLPHHSSTVHLAPHRSVIVAISVRIPANASPGDHLGAIVASLTSTIVSKHHARVHLVQQVACRTLIRVSGPLRPRLTITGLRADYQARLDPVASGVTTLQFTVRNTGNVLLGARESVSVHGLLGSTETLSDIAAIPVMLPGGSAQEAVKVNGAFPELLMSARVTLVPLVATGQDDPGLSNYSAKVGFWAIPWILLALVLALILFAVGAWRWRRRRHRGPRATQSGGPAPVTSGVEA